MSEWREIQTELWFRWWAPLSGQILCSEPDGPPQEGVVRPHDIKSMHYYEKCADCGAQT